MNKKRDMQKINREKKEKELLLEELASGESFPWERKSPVE